MRRDSCPSTTFSRRTSAGTCSRMATTRRTVPFKGEASYWSVRVGDRVAENAMWGYPDPIDGAPPIAGYRALYWNTMDGWLEEDEEAIVHVRDPYHRVDVLDTSRHVRVSVEGETLAESNGLRVIYE